MRLGPSVSSWWVLYRLRSAWRAGTEPHGARNHHGGSVADKIMSAARTQQPTQIPRVGVLMGQSNNADARPPQNYSTGGQGSLQGDIGHRQRPWVHSPAMADTAH